MLVEDRTEVEQVAGRTTSRELDRLLTVIWPILLWMLCGSMLRGASTPYIQGFVDGAFALLITRSVVVLGRDYAARGGVELDQARSGLLIGLGAVVAMAVASAIGVYLFWR